VFSSLVAAMPPFAARPAFVCLFFSHGLLLRQYFDSRADYEGHELYASS